MTVPVESTEPDGSNVDAVTPVLEELLAAYDEAVEAILVDPRVAADPDSAEVVAYLGLFVADSVFAEGALAFWAGAGEAGRFYRPGPSGDMLVTTVQSVMTVSADEVSIAVCTVRSYQIVDESGELVESQASRGGGTVVAVRVDGRWRLRDLSQADVEECTSPPPTSGSVG